MSRAKRQQQSARLLFALRSAPLAALALLAVLCALPFIARTEAAPDSSLITHHSSLGSRFSWLGDNSDIYTKILTSGSAHTALATPLWAGELLAWNTFGNAGTETTEPSTINDPNISAANLTLGSVTAAANGNRFGGSNWFDTGDTNPTTLAESIAGNDYIQFIVTPNTGASFTPTSLVFSWDHSATGPGSVTLRSSADSFATDLGSVTGLAASITTGNTITISGITNRTVPTTFRLYGYGATATGGTGGFDTASSLNNVVLFGTTTISPPSAQKLFQVSSMYVGEQTLMTINVNNPNSGTALTGVSWSDTLPTGLSYNGDSGPDPVCGGSLTKSGNVMTLTGATIAPLDGCNISVAVIANGAATGLITNTTTAVTSTNGGTGNSASAQITVNPVPDLSISDVSQAEGNGPGTTTMSFTVTRSGDLSGTSTVNYSTTAGTATQGSCGTPGNDYQSASGLLTFVPTDASETITVTICGDTTPEPDETFTVTLATPSNATISDATGDGTIQNDDGSVTYTWNPTSVQALALCSGLSNQWICPGNWTPLRPTAASASTTDILIFDGTVTPSPTILNVPTQTNAAIQFKNNINEAKFEATLGAATLTFNGNTGSDFAILTGSALRLQGSNAITIALTAAGQEGIVSGSLIFQGAAHQLTGANAGEIVFFNSSIFTTTTGFSGHPFGSGTDGSVVFDGGSSAFFGAGADPFGGAGKNIVSFGLSPMSSQEFSAASAFDSNGRSYGNLTLTGGQTYAGSGSGLFIVFGNFDLGSSSTLTLSGTAGGDMVVNGNWTNNGTFAPNGRTVVLSGIASQTINTGGSGAGKSFFGLNVTNSSGGVTVNGSLGMNPTGPLGLTYASGSPTLAMTNGSFNLVNTIPVTVSPTSQLGAGDYVLISAGSGGSVTGTAPTNLTIAGSGIAPGMSATLQISSSQLVLHVSYALGDVAFNVAGATIGKLNAANGSVAWSLARSNDNALAVDQSDFGVYTGKGGFGSGAGSTYKYNAAGALVWTGSVTTGAGFCSFYYVNGAAVDVTSSVTGVVFTEGSCFGAMAKSNRLTGAQIWSVSTNDIGRPTIDPANGQIYDITYAGGPFNQLYSVTTGGVASTSTSCQGVTDLNPADGNLYRGGNMGIGGCGLQLSQLNKAALTTPNWSFSVPGIASFDSLAVQPWSGGYIYVGSSTSSKVVVVDPATQTVVRSFSTAIPPTVMAVNPNGGTLYIADSVTNSVLAYSPQGTLLWTSPNLGGAVYGLATARNVVGTPPNEADYCNLQFPTSFSVTAGATTPQIFGRVFESGVTPPLGSDPSITAEVGYGPLGSDPRTGPGNGWTWAPSSFNTQIGNDDEYVGTFTAPAAGSYSYTYRFSFDNGANFTYADINGNGTNVGLSFDTAQLGTMTVNPAAAPEINVQGNGQNIADGDVGSSRVDLQACKLEYSIVSPK